MSNITQTDIVNLALSKLGASPITSYADDTSANARYARVHYQPTLRAELRARRWSFSIKRAELAQLTDVPLYDYELAYALPSDFLRLLDVQELSGWNPAGFGFSIESNMLLTNISPCRIRYLSTVDDPNDWDACFVEAFACKLAVALAQNITNSSTKRQMAQGEYKEALAVARLAGALERDNESIAPDTWMLSRVR